MTELIIDVPDNLKDNLMLRAIVEEKEFLLLKRQLGFEVGKPTKLNKTDVIIKDIEWVEPNQLKFFIIEI